MVARQGMDQRIEMIDSLRENGDVSWFWGAGGFLGLLGVRGVYLFKCAYERERERCMGFGKNYFVQNSQGK